MESLGVILLVEESTQWCAGMVVVPKPSGALRICVNFHQLNMSMLHEVHPLPKVDVMLAQLAGALIFSKLDANCSFGKLHCWRVMQTHHIYYSIWGVCLQ